MPDQQSFLARLFQPIKDRLAKFIGTTVLIALTTVWSLHATGIYVRLHAVLEDKGMVALIFVLLAASIWCGVGWWIAQKKEKPLYERLEPVPGEGYSVDKKTGEIACPGCASKNIFSPMRKAAGDGFVNYQCYVCSTMISRKA